MRAGLVRISGLAWIAALALAGCRPTTAPAGIPAVLVSPILPTEAGSSPTLDATSVPASQTPEPPLPTATPVPVLRQLTTGGCCGQSFWSPDGQRLLFIDRPSPADPAGIWGVSLQGGPLELFSPRVGIYSNDLQLAAALESGQTVVERLSDGQRWTIPNDGRAVSFSPDGAQIAWTIDEVGGPLDVARREIWISRVDGSEPRLALALYGGNLAGWFPDGRLLVSGRLDLEAALTGYYAWSAGDEALVEIAQGARLRGAALSPGGTWLAYLVAFSPEPAENGLWLANTGTGERRRLEVFGAYRWRDDGRLLVIPLDLSAPSHQLWQVEATTGNAQPLTDPAVTPFKIANGDWTVAPGGRQIAFLASGDNNIWLLELPQE